MYSPILEALENHIKKNRVSFHTPSHKGAEGSVLSVFNDYLKYDATEIPDTVGLFASHGPVFDAQELAAKAFGTAATLFSAGGCTLAIQTMLRLVCPAGGRIIAGRNLHPSAVNAFALLDIDPIFINPDDTGRINPDAVRQALSNNNDIKAVYLTSPDYFGIMSDVRAISEIADKDGIPVIVDNAHGTHLLYGSEDLHPIKNGAAMSADSAHKTQPVLTAGAYLQIADAKFKEGAVDAMKLFASTSPSFPVLLSLDLCRAWLEEKGREEFARLNKQLECVRSALKNTPLTVPGGLVDPYRIAFDASCLNVSNDKLYEFFHSRSIEPEFINNGAVVFIPSPLNTEADIIKLSEAIKQLPLIASTNESSKRSQPYFNTPKKVMTIRQAVMSEFEYLPVESSIGRIAAAAEFICPPGFALTVPGEIIDGKTAENLYNASIFHIKVVK